MSYEKSSGPPPVEAPYTDSGQQYQPQQYPPQPGGGGETSQAAPPPYPSSQGSDAAPTAPPPAYQEAAGPAPYTVSGQQPPPQQGAYPPQQYSSGAYPPQQYAPAGNQPPVQQYAPAPGPAMPGYAAPGYAAPGYGPPPPPGVTIITATGHAAFGPNPCTMQCQHCQANITTTVDRKTGTAAWAAVGIICLVGLFVFPLVLLGCCFIPLCIPSMKDVQHSCPNCQKQLGFYARMR